MLWQYILEGCPLQAEMQLSKLSNVTIAHRRSRSIEIPNIEAQSRKMQGSMKDRAMGQPVRSRSHRAVLVIAQAQLLQGQRTVMVKDSGSYSATGTSRKQNEDRDSIQLKVRGWSSCFLSQMGCPALRPGHAATMQAVHMGCGHQPQMRYMHQSQPKKWPSI